MMETSYRIIGEYKGFNIIVLNARNISKCFGVLIDGYPSAFSLNSEQAAKNVIDTYIRSQKKQIK